MERRDVPAEVQALAAQLRAVQLAYVQLETAYRNADRIGRFGWYWQQVAAVLYPTYEQSRRTNALDALICAAERLADVSAQGDGSDEFDSVVAAYAGSVVEALAAYRAAREPRGPTT